MALDEETIAMAKRAYQLNVLMDVPILDACDQVGIDKNAYYQVKRQYEDDWQAERYLPQDVMERVETVEETMERIEGKIKPTEVALKVAQSEIVSFEKRVDAVEEHVSQLAERLNRIIQTFPEERQAELEETLGEYATIPYVRDAQAGTRNAVFAQLEDEVGRLEERLASIDELEERISRLEEDSEQKGLFG